MDQSFLVWDNRLEEDHTWREQCKNDKSDRIYRYIQTESMFYAPATRESKRRLVYIGAHWHMQMIVMNDTRKKTIYILYICVNIYIYTIIYIYFLFSFQGRHSSSCHADSNTHDDLVASHIVPCLMYNLTRVTLPSCC